MREEHGKLMFQWLIPFACAVIVILIMVFNFSNKIRQEAVEAVADRLEEAAERDALKIDGELEGICSAGEIAAQAAEKRPVSLENVRRLLEAVTDHTEAYEAIYCDKDQNAIDHLGNPVDLGKADYIKKLENNSDLEYYFERDDPVTGASAILFIIPVGETENDILLYYPVERLSAVTQLKGKFEETDFAVVIDMDGEIFQAVEGESKFLKGNNIWMNIDEECQKAILNARGRMENRRTGSFAASAGGVEERILVYAPVGDKNWMLVAGISQSCVDHSQEVLFSKSMHRLYQLSGAIFLFCLMMMVINYMGRIRNAEKSKNLQEKADTDLLTGLNNKLATERKIKEYMEQCPNSLAMIFVLDIDNFKKINDTMGHAFGDEVLRSLGKQIGVNFRVTDIIGRTGGDEFMIFLKNLQKDENVLKEAQKLAYFFKHFQVGEYVKYSATASIGAAVFPADGDSFEALYKSADQALYKAKRRGKNQIAFFDDRDRHE